VVDEVNHQGHNYDNQGVEGLSGVHVAGDWREKLKKNAENMTKKNGRQEKHVLLRPKQRHK